MMTILYSFMRERSQCVAMLVAVWTVMLLSMGAGQAAGAPVSDEEAKLVLERMSEFYKEVSAISYRASIRRGQVLDGDRTILASSFRMALQRPDRLTIEPLGENAELKGTIRRFGEQLYTYDPASGRYAIEQVAGPAVDVFGDEVFERLCGEVVSLAGLPMRAEPYDAIMTGVESTNHAGVAERDGAAMHRIELREAQIGWRLWIEAGPRPVLRRIEADLSMLEAAAKQQGHDLQAFIEVELSEWRFNDDVKESTFVIEPAAGAERVPALFAHPLRGQRAPLFELKDLAEQPVRLADHRNRDVVVLDFWATWCGPCVASLPKLAELAATYRAANKPVKVYAVNIGEKPEAIEAFLRQHKLDVSVLLDADSAVAKAYQVNAIPQTVIIDRDGVVRRVWVGAAADLDDRIRDQLDLLLR